MDGRKRTVQIKFRVTEAERDLILEKMKLVPTRNMAAYLRKIAIDGYIIQIDHADIKAMTAEIQKIGVNVNQIARHVNATGNAYQEDIDPVYLCAPCLQGEYVTSAFQFRYPRHSVPPSLSFSALGRVDCGEVVSRLSDLILDIIC